MTTTDLRARRLLLSAAGLDLLRRRVLPAPLSLPPGFSCVADAGEAASEELLAVGAATAVRDGTWAPHPAVADDLRVLAAPELAVGVRAARPGLDVTACLALRGLRGAALLHTGGTAVQLSAFAATHLADELARVVPAPLRPQRDRAAEELPLHRLLDGSPSRLGGRAPGTLRATVTGGPTAPDRPSGAVGSVGWVWDGAGWVGLEPLPSRAGRPWVRLVPVVPSDLGSWLAPLLAGAAT